MWSLSESDSSKHPHVLYEPFGVLCLACDRILPAPSIKFHSGLDCPLYYRDCENQNTDRFFYCSIGISRKWYCWPFLNPHNTVPRKRYFTLVTAILTRKKGSIGEFRLLYWRGIIDTPIRALVVPLKYDLHLTCWDTDGLWGFPGILPPSLLRMKIEFLFRVPLKGSWKGNYKACFRKDFGKTLIFLAGHPKEYCL